MIVRPDVTRRCCPRLGPQKGPNMYKLPKRYKSRYLYCPRGGLVNKFPIFYLWSGAGTTHRRYFPVPGDVRSPRRRRPSGRAGGGATAPAAMLRAPRWFAPLGSKPRWARSTSTVCGPAGMTFLEGGRWRRCPECRGRRKWAVKRCKGHGRVAYHRQKDALWHPCPKRDFGYPPLLRPGQ
jgi:hypothetical protein